MAVSLPKDLGLFVSLGSHATYGTTVATSRKIIAEKSWRPARDVATQLPNQGLLTGVENATQMDLERKHYAGNVPFGYVYPDNLAWCLTFMLGAAPTSGVYNTDTAILHSFTDVRSSHALLQFSVQELHAASVGYTYDGCLGQNWTLSKAVGSPPTMNLGWVAKTKTADVTTSGTVLTGEIAWLDTPVYVRIGAYGASGSLLSAFAATAVPTTGWDQPATTNLAATPVDWSGVARSFDIGITNFGDVGNLLTFSGAALARAERDIRQVTVSNLVVEYDPATPDVETYINSLVATATDDAPITSYGLEIGWQSTLLVPSAVTTYFGCKFLFGRITFNDVSYNIDDATGKMLVTFSLNVLHDEADYGLGAGVDFGLMRAAVWNAVAASVYGAV